MRKRRLRASGSGEPAGGAIRGWAGGRAAVFRTSPTSLHPTPNPTSPNPTQPRPIRPSTQRHNQRTQANSVHGLTQTGAAAAKKQLWEGNTIQIFVHVIFNACLFAYSILQITQLKGALSGIVNGPEAYNKIFPLLVTSCVVLAVFTLLFAWLSFKLYLEFGWEIFKRIGASPVMHRTCAIERAEWRRRAGREQKGGQAFAPGMLNQVARHIPAPTTAASNHPDRRAPLLLRSFPSSSPPRQQRCTRPTWCS